ncbi:hypothetical protein F4861DRAFT_310135 [Xylaria intraflava]|nr:hypothetical protein F4861DRAFT_310135 [Xylaria intraflava]
MPTNAMSIDNLCNDYAQEDFSKHPNWATPEDWDAHQETIRRLYLDEKRPLKDVVVIMESEYGFRATYVPDTTSVPKFSQQYGAPHRPVSSLLPARNLNIYTRMRVCVGPGVLGS